MHSSLDAQAIVATTLHDPNHVGIVLAQTAHRIRLVQSWSIQSGATVLELGCGQGDCTAVLAEAVGSNGRIVAVDPGDPSYGAPYTLHQAQSHLSSSRLASRINFVHADPIPYLRSLPNDQTFDVAVLSHCTWYFASPSVLASTFSALSGRVRRICIAEYALSSNSPGGHAHVLAALTQAALECRKDQSESNIRTVFSVPRITMAARDAGFLLQQHHVITPSEDLYDGRWEVATVLSDAFAQEIQELDVGEREKEVVLALRDAVQAAVDGLDGGLKSVATMNVWSGVFSSVVA